MRLYTHTRNSCGWRVRIALAAKAIPYEVVWVTSLPEGAWRRLNPQGLLPALEVKGRVIAQSPAIFEYLEETQPTPPLLPVEPIARAECRAFAQLVVSDLHPINNNRVRTYLAERMAQPEAAVLAWYRHWVAEGLASLEAAIRDRAHGGPFCFGASPTWADACLVPQLHNARRFGCDLDGYPTLLEAESACATHPAFEAAQPERW